MGTLSGMGVCCIVSPVVQPLYSIFREENTSPCTIRGIFFIVEFGFYLRSLSSIRKSSPFVHNNSFLPNQITVSIRK